MKGNLSFSGHFKILTEIIFSFINIRKSLYVKKKNKKLFNKQDFRSLTQIDMNITTVNVFSCF